ncbi:MAG: diguanylate cyclase [Clostridia bacterium]|nr:diguanylate cyclase [Clostridia bacterium]
MAEKDKTMEALGPDILNQLFDTAPDMICITRVDGFLLKVNRASKSILGYEPAEIEGTYPTQYIHPDDAGKLDQTLHEILDEGLHTEFNQYINRFRHKDGSYRYLEWNTRLYHDHYYCVARDVSDRISYQQKIEYLSYHDTLTGLYNRRFCEEEIRRMDTARNLPISIIMGDMNRLKLMNDIFGHEKGDEYIRMASDIIRTECRPDDIIARWGGDEFVILLPKTSQIDARKIVSRIIMSKKKQQVNGIPVSIAFGLATKSLPGDNLSGIIVKAEKNMYRSKATCERSRKDFIDWIIRMLFEKSAVESQHAKRVQQLCKQMAVVLGFDQDLVERIALAGFLHDIGKIAISTQILEKSDALTEEEVREVQKHVMIGSQIIGKTHEWHDIGYAILSHHEYIDGSGYPKGISDQDIPLIAKIIALAECYDAMTQRNNDQEKMTVDQAIAEIRRNAGRQFDSELAEIFIKQVLQQP